MYLCLQASLLHNSIERETQKRQGDNWAVSQTLQAVLMQFFARRHHGWELAGEKQTKIHAKISTTTSCISHHRWRQIIHARNLYQNTHPSWVSHRIILSLPTKSSPPVRNHLSTANNKCENAWWALNMRAGPDSTSRDQWGSIALLTSYLLPNTWE